MQKIVLISGEDEPWSSNDPVEKDEIPTTQSATPTKLRLRKQIAKHRRREARLRKKLKQANGLNAHLKKKTNMLQVAKDVIATHLSGTAYELVMAQLAGSVGRRKRWSKNMKLYCLSLYYKSPTAYRFLRKTFFIPQSEHYRECLTNSKSSVASLLSCSQC